MFGLTCIPLLNRSMSFQSSLDPNHAVVDPINSYLPIAISFIVPTPKVSLLHRNTDLEQLNIPEATPISNKHFPQATLIPRDQQQIVASVLTNDDILRYQVMGDLHY